MKIQPNNNEIISGGGGKLVYLITSNAITLQIDVNFEWMQAKQRRSRQYFFFISNEGLQKQAGFNTLCVFVYFWVKGRRECVRANFP